MRYHVLHKTQYDYERTATLSQQLLHMTPRDFHFQDCHFHQINVSPVANELVRNFDYFGNIIHHLSIFTPHKSLVVESESNIELLPRPDQFALQNSQPWDIVRHGLSQQTGANSEAVAYLFDSPNVSCSDKLESYARTSFVSGRLLLDAALDLTQRIYQDFEFDPEATDVATPLAEVLEGRRGVCQDFAHLMIGCLRSIGLSCRYVSGYILTSPPAGRERLIGADASHAWVSVYCPTYGWVDFDPTNNCLVHNEHITVAWGRDFSDVSPMRGVVLGGGNQTLEVSVTVTPVYDQLKLTGLVA
ncbi:MAG TPA: transglutaminase family protein [Methylophilaceae bacterium]|nr:transglutaminase family protein [Methylophilaceae bacterium]